MFALLRSGAFHLRGVSLGADEELSRTDLDFKLSNRPIERARGWVGTWGWVCGVVEKKIRRRFCDGLFGMPKVIFPHLIVIRGSESPVSEQHTQFLEVLELLCRSTLRRV